MTTAKAEPPIPREQVNLEPFSEEGRLRLRELTWMKASWMPRTGTVERITKPMGTRSVTRIVWERESNKR
jgi:hypothetical protein